jgi:acyl-CoA synthetase (NDP forming)
MFGARSVAIVGASPRPGSIGERVAVATLGSGFSGQISLVNPRHTSIMGRPCVPSLSDLDTPPDLVVLNVGASRIEAALGDAIEAGARSAVIFDICHGTAADGTPLVERLRHMAREAGIPVCGGNGMGFFEVPGRRNASFYPSDQLRPGGITLIAHSGSVFTVLALNDPRYRFDLVVSPGQEIGATLDEYIDYAVLRPTTKVIAVFMEGARDPAGFRRALERANRHGVPVVVCKVGRTEESARLARSHTGALAGSDAAYDAVLEATGAVRAETVDQLMNTALMFSQGRGIGDGGIGLVTDSGGLREAAMDRAEALQVPLAQFSPGLTSQLEAVLPPPLTPSNPQDCAGALVDDFEQVFEDALGVLAASPEIALLGFECDARDDYAYSGRLVEILRGLSAMTGKPCFGYTSFAQTNNRGIAAELADLGLPLINGLDAMLEAARSMIHWRDRRGTQCAPGPADAEKTDRWRARLQAAGGLGESGGLDLFADFGLPVVGHRQCATWAETRDAAATLGYPVVLKTAGVGIEHKTDQAGVVLGLANEAALQAAHTEMTGRLGPAVLVQPMAGKGVELAIGCVMDPDFGPLVMVSAGGTLVELLADRRFALAPFGVEKAQKMIGELSVGHFLAGVRGAPAADSRAAARALSAFSAMCAALGDAVAEIDANPVIVSPEGAVIVDALVVPGTQPEAQ